MVTATLLALFSLASFVPTQALAADSYSSNGCTVSPRTTSNRAIQLEGKVPDSTVWVWIEVKKGEQTEDIFIYRPQTGRFAQEIYARFGPGKYQITVYRTTSNLQYGTKYYEHAKLYFNNTNNSAGYNIKTSTNSAFYLDIPFYPQEQTLHFQISDPLGRYPEAIFQLDTATASGARIHLPFGPGRHDIKIWGIDSQQNDFSYNEFSVVNTDNRGLNWLLPSTEVQSDHPLIIALAKEITMNTKNDREKATMVHKWVASNISYDAEGVRTGSFRNSPQDALSTLLRKEAVCAGYSNLYAALLRSAGVKTKVVSGVAGQDKKVDLTLDYSLPTNQSAKEDNSHAWNKVFLDSQWLNVDATWDAGHVTNNRFYKKFSSDYLLQPDQAFKKDHLWLADEPF
jgi:transglutaminase-like putative cysteine protease